MQKFRESLKQIDGPNDLCKLMPGTAERFMCDLPPASARRLGFLGDFLFRASI
jgi:hypothetical protein